MQIICQENKRKKKQKSGRDDLATCPSGFRNCYKLLKDSFLRFNVLSKGKIADAPLLQ